MNLLKPDAVWIKRVPDDYDLGFEIEGLGTDEVVESVAVSVAPSGLALGGSPSIADNKVSERVHGGVAGQVYRLRFVVTTNTNDYTFDYEVKVIP